jgi:hypothetical protein
MDVARWVLEREAAHARPAWTRVLDAALPVAGIVAVLLLGLLIAGRPAAQRRASLEAPALGPAPAIAIVDDEKTGRQVFMAAVRPLR